MGLALAREYLERGWRVGIVGRDPAKQEEAVSTLRRSVADGFIVGALCDVSDSSGIRPAFENLVRDLGQLDLFIYCAGVMPPAGHLAARLSSIDPIVDVNVRGAFHFLEWAADRMEAGGRGRIAAIGSVAGDRGRKGHPVYGASKAAVHQYLEGLRHRLHGTGVGVTTIKPGWVKTRMLGEAAADSPLAIDTKTAAQIIVRGLAKGRETLFVPWWWRAVSGVIRILPSPVFKRFAPP